MLFRSPRSAPFSLIHHTFVSENSRSRRHPNKRQTAPSSPALRYTPEPNTLLRSRHAAPAVDDLARSPASVNPALMVLLTARSPRPFRLDCNYGNNGPEQHQK